MIFHLIRIISVCFCLLSCLGSEAWLTKIQSYHASQVTQPPPGASFLFSSKNVCFHNKSLLYFAHCVLNCFTPASAKSQRYQDEKDLHSQTSTTFSGNFGINPHTNSTCYLQWLGWGIQGLWQILYLEACRSLMWPGFQRGASRLVRLWRRESCKEGTHFTSPFWAFECFHSLHCYRILL